jgi:hypothetical protein
MKHDLLIFFIAGIWLSGCSSDEFEIKQSDVPPNVVAALKTKYPSA